MEDEGKVFNDELIRVFARNCMEAANLVATENPDLQITVNLNEHRETDIEVDAEIWICGDPDSFGDHKVTVRSGTPAITITRDIERLIGKVRLHG